MRKSREIVAASLLGAGALLSVLLPSASPAFARNTNKSKVSLISTTDLQTAVSAAQTTGPLILDARGGYKDYISGHVPGARHINFDTLRGTDASGVPVQYLPDDMTRELLERAGVATSGRMLRETIVYADGGAGDGVLSATMVAYVLEKFGVPNVRILDGGLDDYAAVNKTSQEYPLTPRGKIAPASLSPVGVDLKTLLVDKDKKNVVMIDARPENEYLGNDTVWPRKGHIPGAISIPWRKVVDAKNSHKFLSVAETQKMFIDAGVTPDKDIIVYCGTSREGSLLRFYLRHMAGYPNVRLYEGSWKEYAARRELPVQTAAPAARG